ncbi:MAG: glycosyltransferase family 39 protein [Anaerolineae bacterium]
MTAESRAVPRYIEGPIVIAIVLIAIIFRFVQFNQVPPGLHYDEAIDAKLAQEIRAGAMPIYFEEGWGREPLYHYLVAFTLNFTPDPTTALRVTSALLGLIQLLAAYALFRSLFGVPTALIGAAWIAVLFWTVSTSRAGLRNITLTTLATLTAWAFWRVFANASRKRQVATTAPRWQPASSLLPGVLLGLTVYTYQPSRVVPLIFIGFAVYLWLFNRIEFRSSWRVFASVLLIAAVVAVPLIGFLLTHPNAETGRAFQTEPLRALLSGNVQPAMETAVATLKMFTVEGGGDPQILYNLSGRPLFIGLGSLLFGLGLIISLVRFKRLAYAFMLLWLIVTLLPNMLTAPAPFFYRAIAAQTPVALLPAIGTTFVWDLFRRKGETRYNWLAISACTLIAVVSLGQTAVTTWHDYFDVWGNNSDVRFQYSAALTDIAHTLNASTDTSPVAVSSFFIEDADPVIFSQTLTRRDVPVRWFDARDAIVIVADTATQRLAVPSFTPLDPQLQSEFLPDLEPITWTKDFKLYALDAAQFRQKIEAWTCMVCPVTFDDTVTLMGLQTTQANKVLTIQSVWRVVRDGQPTSTAIFTHLLNAAGQPAKDDAGHDVGDDRLDVPPHTWRVGDEFVQIHRISIADLAPGVYTLELGLYDRGDNRRWAATDQSGRALGDRVLLNAIEVTP